MSEFVFSANEVAVLELLRTRGLATTAQMAVFALLPPSAVREAVEHLRDINLVSDQEPIALTRRGVLVLAAPMKVSEEASANRDSKNAPDAPPSVTMPEPDDTSRIRLKASAAAIIPVALQDDDQLRVRQPEVTP